VWRGNLTAIEEIIMAETLKDKVEAAGHKITEAATKVGHRVGEKVEEVTDWAKQKSHQVGNRIGEAAQKAEHKAKETFGDDCGKTLSIADIREHMDVFGSCGNRLGKVDHVDGNTIKLTKNDSPDGQHHLIPIGWVKRVDEHVHLNKSCGEAAMEWETA
jgi:hypothetical protein